MEHFILFLFQVISFSVYVLFLPVACAKALKNPLKTPVGIFFEKLLPDKYTRFSLFRLAPN